MVSPRTNQTLFSQVSQVSHCPMVGQVGQGGTVLGQLNDALFAVYPDFKGNTVPFCCPKCPKSVPKCPKCPMVGQWDSGTNETGGSAWT